MAAASLSACSQSVVPKNISSLVASSEEEKAVMPVSGSRRTSMVCSAYSMPASGLKKPASSTLRWNWMRSMRPLSDAGFPAGMIRPPAVAGQGTLRRAARRRATAQPPRTNREAARVRRGSRRSAQAAIARLPETSALPIGWTDPA